MWRVWRGEDYAGGWARGCIYGDGESEAKASGNARVEEEAEVYRCTGGGDGAVSRGWSEREDDCTHDAGDIRYLMDGAEQSSAW